MTSWNSTLSHGKSLGRTAGLQPSGPWVSSMPPMGRTQLQRHARIGQVRGSWPKGKSAATRRAGSGSGRRESFPPAVAALIDARDLWCIHCGSPRDLQRHHRRIKGMGGDPRPHTDCACVGVRICLTCHDWAHSGKGRREAEAEGLIIPRSTVRPWTLSVLVHIEADIGGLLKYPSCDGRWLDAAELELTA